MSDLILIHTNGYVGIHPFPRVGANDKVAIWGASNGGNLSLKTKLVKADTDLAKGFARLGAAPWPSPPTFNGKPHTTPHGGSNFCGTVLNISFESAKALFEEHGYSFVGGQSQSSRDEKSMGKSKSQFPAPANDDGEMQSVSFMEVLESLADGSLESGYERLVAVLSRSGRFSRIAVPTARDVATAWPSGRGVYVVRWARASSFLESILYIGMTGKLTKKEQGIESSGSGFAGRIDRYTPYCYSSTGRFSDHFEFGPMAAGDSVLELPRERRYEHHVPLSETITDCFLLHGVEREVAPSFLEAILLQMYFRQMATLPAGNNAF